MRSEHWPLWAVVILCFVCFVLGWRATAPRPAGHARHATDGGRVKRHTTHKSGPHRHGD